MSYSNIQLRPTVPSDLDTLFLFQIDEEARYIAAFTSKETSGREAYIEKYARHLNDPVINMQTILVEGRIAGSIAKFEIHGDAEVTYWIDKSLWGKGIATAALQQLLSMEKKRPVLASAASDNIGSQRVLEKCGFIKTGTASGFANARQAETEEFIYKLLH